MAVGDITPHKDHVEIEMIGGNTVQIRTGPNTGATWTAATTTTATPPIYTSGGGTFTGPKGPKGDTGAPGRAGESCSLDEAAVRRMIREELARYLEEELPHRPR